MHRRNFIKAIILSILGSFFPKLLLPVPDEGIYPHMVDGDSWVVALDEKAFDWISIVARWVKGDRLASLSVNGEHVGYWEPKHEWPSPDGTVAYWMLPHDPENFDPLDHCPQDIEYLLGAYLPSDELHYLAGSELVPYAYVEKCDGE